MSALRQRQPRYENRALLDLCHGAPCLLNFPGCTGGTNPNSPSVPCHSNQQQDGRGVGHKTHDHATAPGCPSCSFQLDYGPYTREQKVEVFERARKAWWGYMWEAGLIAVNKRK